MKPPHWLTKARDMHNAARDRRQARKPIPLRPDPEYRARKLAQMTASRRARYFDNARKAGL